MAFHELKQKIGDIEPIYATPYLSLSEQAKIKHQERLKLYDTSIYPSIENVPQKFAICKRNEWMILNSDLIITYAKHNYGGAHKTLQIAKRKKKKIVNICDFI